MSVTSSPGPDYRVPALSRGHRVGQLSYSMRQFVAEAVAARLLAADGSQAQRGTPRCAAITMRRRR